MTIAYWCLLIAAFLHTPFALAAKSQKSFDNNNPRLYLASLSGWRQRANWAQQNSLEAFPMFAAAVLVAHQTGGPQEWIDRLAIAWLILRVVYGLLYIADKASARSLVWFASVGTAVAIFVSSLYA